MVNKFQVRILSRNDWDIYRDIRLASLLDSPDSFGSTYKRESRYPDEEWKTRLGLEGKESSVLPLLAVVDGKPVGLAWGKVDSLNPSVVNIYQMWVSANARGLGIGKELLTEIIDWSVKNKRSEVCLEVTTTNISAIKLYEVIGFSIVGDVEPLRDGSSLCVQPMKLKLK